MIKTSSNLFLYARNNAILFFAFFLLGCQTTSDSGKSMVRSSSNTAQVQSAPTGATPASSDVDSGKPVLAQQNINAEAHSEKYKTESEKLQQCQSQLEALKVMSPAQYTRMRNSFDYLMNGAAQYANLRQKINADTQDTVDALYRYRSNLLCAQIAQTLLDGLTRRGEARP
ncbi:hypothetical protein [Pantoea coffeiphila]|nr:hypothetical protein [Pantoea coffeiphila]